MLSFKQYQRLRLRNIDELCTVSASFSGYCGSGVVEAVAAATVAVVAATGTAAAVIVVLLVFLVAADAAHLLLFFDCLFACIHPARMNG